MRTNSIILALFIFPILLIPLTGLFNPGLAQSHEISVEKVALSSEMIVVGKVNKKQCEWNEDKTRILTKVSIDVDEYVKGERAEQEITIMHWGGEIDGIGELYTHTPRFTENENVLLFVKKDKEENLRVCHGSEGKFRIQEDTTLKFKRVNNKSLDDLKAEIKAFIGSKNK
jgi:hypothetical protein